MSISSRVGSRKAPMRPATRRASELGCEVPIAHHHSLSFHAQYPTSTGWNSSMCSFVLFAVHPHLSPHFPSTRRILLIPNFPWISSVSSSCSLFNRLYSPFLSPCHDPCSSRLCSYYRYVARVSPHPTSTSSMPYILLCHVTSRSILAIVGGRRITVQAHIRRNSGRPYS